jgi:hypothetical protein
MSAGTITWSGDPIEPDTIEEPEAMISGGNIIHTILGRDEPDVTMRPAGLRTGTLVLSFPDEATQAAARIAHQQPEEFALTVMGRSYLDMTYVLSPQGIRSYRTPGGRFVVEVGYQEVTP